MRLFGVLVGLLVGLATGCPEGCRCNLEKNPKTVICKDLGLTSFPGNISAAVEHLDLSGNLLTELPADVNRLAELQHLNLARNKFTSLTGSLRGLGGLRRLDLTGNGIKDALTDLGPISHLTRLRILYLTGNPLADLTGLKNPTVQFISADSCGIEVLKNTSLSGLPELAYLTLAANPLKDIKDPYSLKLKGLDLSKCQLKVLSPRTFQGFPELIDLRLADNPMLVYSTRYETLRHQKLEKLDVSRCGLDRPGLHGLPALTYIRLSSNAIRMLPDHIFAKNRELTHLFLDYNRLERLNKSSFANLSKLQFLDLSANGLKAVPPAAFRNNPELRFVNLSDNYIQDMPRLAGSLSNLDLSANLVNRMDDSCLLGLPRLYHLNLSKNLIEDLPLKLESSSLRSLVLRSNRITGLDNASLTGLPELEKLDLSGNLLRKGIGSEVFFDNPNLRQLHLQDNPWDCDCGQLYSSYVFLMRLATKTESWICHNPRNVTGYSWKRACASEWKRSSLQKGNNKTWGLVLVSVLTVVVLSGTIISIRHSMRLKRQARNQRLEMERAEVRERLRLLQRRNHHLQDEVREPTAEPRVHPLELLGPPSYEEAMTMPRLARSLDGLDSVSAEASRNGMTTFVVARMTASSESLRGAKKRRPRRQRQRAHSEENLARRGVRREERLRRVRCRRTAEGEEVEEEEQQRPELESEERSKPRRTPTPLASKRKLKRLSVASNGTSTDDEDSDGQKPERVVRKLGRTTVRNLEKEPKRGYKASTDLDS